MESILYCTVCRNEIPRERAKRNGVTCSEACANVRRAMKHERMRLNGLCDHCRRPLPKKPSLPAQGNPPGILAFDENTVIIMRNDSNKVQCGDAWQRKSDWRIAAMFALADKYGWKCWYCGKELKPPVRNQAPLGPQMRMLSPYPHLDHIDPVSNGGKTVPSNLALSCAMCNMAKGDAQLEGFLQWLDWLRFGPERTPIRIMLEGSKAKAALAEEDEVRRA